MLLAIASAHGAGYRAGTIAAPILLAAVAVWLTRRALRQPTRRGRLTDAIAALVCAALLAGAIVRDVSHRDAGVWDTTQGRQMHASFVAGCRQTSNGAMDCECLFEHLTARPPGDTPSGFTMLGQSIEYAAQRSDWRLMRPEAREALLACRAAPTS